VTSFPDIYHSEPSSASPILSVFSSQQRILLPTLCV